MMRKRINLGHTNDKYLDKDFLVVVKKKNRFNHNLDYNQTQKFSFVPKLISQNDQEVVWEFIKDAKQLKKPKSNDLLSLAKILSEIHQSKIQLPKNNLRKRVNEYLKIIHDKNIKVAEIENHYRPMIKLLANMRRNIPCHNDVWPDNLLKEKASGKIWLVDWEYATLGDPYFDLAYWITSGRLNDKLRLLFINFYFDFNKTFMFDDNVLKKYEKFCNWITLCWAYAQVGGLPFDVTIIKKALQ